MGEYSHYCNVSSISISGGQECVLIPLKKSTNYNHFNWLPATLPIHGTYTGYGSLKDIKSDNNVKLIENHYGIDIESFTEHIMRSAYDDNPSYVGIDTWMLIDKQVYDDLSANNYNSLKGDLHLGSKELLKFLGFNFIRKDDLLERYKFVWESHGVEVHSDGRWLHHKNGSLIYNITDLFELVNTPHELRYIADKNHSQIWKLYFEESKTELDSSLCWILDQDRYFQDLEMDEIFGRVHRQTRSPDEYPEELQDFVKERNKERELFDKSLTKKYLLNLEIYGDVLAELCTLAYNCQMFSKTFEPQKMLITPQCGEHKWHSIMLEKFKLINDKYIYDDIEE